MIDRSVVFDRLRRLVQAAPGAFRRDPVFRYAVIGSAVALVLLLSSLSGGRGAIPPQTAPAATAALGASYADHTSSAAPSPAQPMASVTPGRSLAGVTERADPQAPPDRFGTLGAAQPKPQQAAE